jgi:hypothetical protein
MNRADFKNLFFIHSTVDQAAKTILVSMRKIVRKTFPLVEDYDFMDTILERLKDDLFAAGTTTADKVLNPFSDALYIRLVWINEMKDKKCDSSVLEMLMENYKLLSSTKMEVNHSNID